jgi:hypothetical protein
MEAAPLESMEAAMPVMVQLPQLTVTALLAVTEQQQAEQVCTHSSVPKLLHIDGSAASDFHLSRLSRFCLKAI